MLRDTRLQTRGIDLGAHVRTPSDVERAAADLRGAQLLNPDPTPDVALALIYHAHARRREAFSILAGAVRREPDNLNTWGLVYSLSRDSDPALARRALAARRRLDPVGARR
jgi:hypothetical protein